MGAILWLVNDNKQLGEKGRIFHSFIWNALLGRLPQHIELRNPLWGWYFCVGSHTNNKNNCTLWGPRWQGLAQSMFLDWRKSLAHEFWSGVPSCTDFSLEYTSAVCTASIMQTLHRPQFSEICHWMPPFQHPYIRSRSHLLPGISGLSLFVTAVGMLSIVIQATAIVNSLQFKQH